MTDFSIPAPEEASIEPSELTQIEMADLSASKRNTVLYERTIDSLNKDLDYLKNKLDASDNERREAISKLDDYVDKSYKVPLLRRENIEMYVMFALVTVSMQRRGNPLCLPYVALGNHKGFAPTGFIKAFQEAGISYNALQNT